MLLNLAYHVLNYGTIIIPEPTTEANGEITAILANGNVDVLGMSGNVTARMANGDIEQQDMNGDIERMQ